MAYVYFQYKFETQKQMFCVFANDLVNGEGSLHFFKCTKNINYTY